MQIKYLWIVYCQNSDINTHRNPTFSPSAQNAHAENHTATQAERELESPIHHFCQPAPSEQDDDPFLALAAGPRSQLQIPEP